MPELIVKLGDQTLQTCRFDGELLCIGRSRENDVVLENLSVSRQHVQIRLHQGRFVLTDMNSANGTLVNGVRVTKTEIVDEDIITVGKHKLLFQTVSASVGTDDQSAEQRTVMVEPRPDAWMIVDSGRLKGREFKITRFETSLGKAPSNDVVLTDDWLLGKKQAIILRKGNSEFEIQDLGGLRRVKVNGTAISERQELKDGDRIEMGGTALIFHSEMGPPKPTGRVPCEITAENTPSEKLAGAFARPANGASRPFSGDPLENESLDLEDGYPKVNLRVQKEDTRPEELRSTTPAPEAEELEQPAEISANTEEPRANDSSMDATGAFPAAAQTNGSKQQRNVFEDTRSGRRRRRKHQKRAAQRQETAAESADNQAETPVNGSTAVAGKSAGAEMSSDKEIMMWEAALNNSSPAIRRQAVKTLKKLTGRDYEV